MSNRFARGHRDTNEPKITAVLRQYGIPYGLLPEGFGADILALPGPAILVEVKNPAQRPSDRRLTETEQIIRDYCGERRIPYHVVETAEEMNALVGRYIGTEITGGQNERDRESIE